jgi:AcrR family transcriptional regulator
MSSNEIDTRTKILDATWRLMEQHRGQGVRMIDIAKATGISRQAVYLHFGSRTELMIATTQYVDEVKGLNERLNHLRAAKTGVELLEACVEVWGNHIPEIYGLAKAMLRTRETDEATAAAWDNNMSCLRDVCREIIEAIDHEGILAPEWSRSEAIEMLWTMLSFHNWEQLAIECGWSTAQYINWMKTLLKRTFVYQNKMAE